MSTITTTIDCRGTDGEMSGGKRDIKMQKERAHSSRGSRGPLIDCRLNVLIAVFLHVITLEKMILFVHTGALFIGLLQWIKTHFRRIKGTLGQADGK